MRGHILPYSSPDWVMSSSCVSRLASPGVGTPFTAYGLACLAGNFGRRVDPASSFVVGPRDILQQLQDASTITPKYDLRGNVSDNCFSVPTRGNIRRFVHDLVGGGYPPPPALGC